MHKYTLISKKGEGTFSEVLKAQCLKNQKCVAIKCMKSHFENINQVQNLREIQALRKLSPHPHIIKLIEVLYDEPTGRLAMVFELMDKNLYELIQNKRTMLNERNVKAIIYQLLKAVQHMHKNGIFHRDIKPENILITEDTVKLADFGSCRGISNQQPFTEYISTRWYRAPECLLTDGYYNYKMDIWGIGCVMYEILSKAPLFPGKNELGQIQIIHKILGTPDAEILERFQKQATHMEFNFPAQQGTGIARQIPYASPECLDIIEKMLIYNPDERLTAKQCLKHPFFKELRELDKRTSQGVPSIPRDLMYPLAPERSNAHKEKKEPSSQQIYIPSGTQQEPMFPDVNIKTTIMMDIQHKPNKPINNFVSEESDGGENLPPIIKNPNLQATMQPSAIQQQIKMGTQTIRKTNFVPEFIPTNPMKVNPGKRKEGGGNKKQYISPYSQKAVVVQK